VQVDVDLQHSLVRLKPQSGDVPTQTDTDWCLENIFLVTNVSFGNDGGKITLRNWSPTDPVLEGASRKSVDS